MKKIFLTLLFLVPGSFLFPWTDGGHKLVGYIAGEYLSAAACSNIYKFIKNDLTAGSNSLEQQVKAWIIQIAPDADYISNKVGAWHYIDLPEASNWTRNDISAYIAANTDNVVSQLSNETAFFAKGKNKPDSKAYTNLMLLIHFAGDIAQPMHNIDFNGDSGGNDRVFTNLYEFYQGHNKRVSLHLLWDLEANTNDVTDIDGKGKELASDISNMILTNAGLIANWTNGSLIDWSYESYLIGRNIYSNLSITNGTKSMLAMTNFSEYRSNNQETAFMQIKKGGFRLAYLLNTLFGKK